jgi:hypothetical protein
VRALFDAYDRECSHFTTKLEQINQGGKALLNVKTHLCSTFWLAVDNSDDVNLSEFIAGFGDVKVDDADGRSRTTSTGSVSESSTHPRTSSFIRMLSWSSRKGSKIDEADIPVEVTQPEPRKEGVSSLKREKSLKIDK